METEEKYRTFEVREKRGGHESGEQRVDSR
jgi:hypothetical protein